MTDREKLIQIIDSSRTYAADKESLADHLIANGVRLETEQATSDENKRIEELEAQLAEREKVVIQLREQWQDAEMHICTMCGHFDHKTDGNLIYGNRTCGEACGYPFCKEKFTPWIPVSERLPEEWKEVLVLSEFDFCETAVYLGIPGKWRVTWNHAMLEENSITHWMPLPEPPIKENT